MSWLMNRRRGVGKSLPYDAEVEYLIFNGSQYIDTGIVGNQDTSYEIDYYNESSTAGLFGCREYTNVSKNSVYVFLLNAQSFQVGYNTHARNYNYNTLGRHTIKLNNAAFYYDNILVEDTFTYSDFNTDNTLLLGAFHSGTKGSTVDARKFSGYIYLGRILDGTTLVRDYIPVRKNGIGYMYDKVSGRLFGDESGEGFSYGADK